MALRPLVRPVPGAAAAGVSATRRGGSSDGGRAHAVEFRSPVERGELRAVVCSAGSGWSRNGGDGGCSQALDVRGQVKRRQLRLVASSAGSVRSSGVEGGREARRELAWRLSSSALPSRASDRTCARRSASVVAARAVVDSNQRAEPKQRANLSASRVEKYVIKEAEKQLAEYMSLPASQYSVLDAERIERVDETSFRCYAPRLKFFSFEVRPVLLVEVEVKPNGCCIKLLSCKLEGSPLVVAQNEKFTAYMVNNVSWQDCENSPAEKQLISDTSLEVTLDTSGVISFIPRDLIERTGSQVLGQVLRAMMPRFLAQLGKDYHAWASGDIARKPLGTGEI